MEGAVKKDSEKMQELANYIRELGIKHPDKFDKMCKYYADANWQIRNFAHSEAYEIELCMQKIEVLLENK